MAEPTSAADNQILKPHSNAIVPHKIANHDTEAVQLNVWNGTEWVNIYDGNDMRNMNIDLHKVSKVVEKHAAEIPAVESAANSAVEQAESAVSASKVNSEAIAAQSEAVSEAKSAMDSANADIQQLKDNVASDIAKINADVAQVQNEISTAKAANSASVDQLKSDIDTAKQNLAAVSDSLTKAQATAEESQKAIDKSIAQINSDIEQDRKDITSAQQANADTAKQLDTYSKQAQDQGKTIKSIQDKQDGFTATLADVQGNVTQVSDKVDGLSASLKDAQDNVASVKAQADQLSATLTDHAKSIATLTASAKELSSTLEDADGRLSKVEQTAQTNSSTLSDVQGDLSQVKQDATTLTATLKDAQGNISTLQQKADSVSAQLTSAQGDIASLQTDVTGIKATLVSHEGDIHTLQADSKSLHDSMQDAQGDISTLKKTSTDVTSELKDHAGRISKTEQTASTLVNEFADQQGHLNRVEQTAQGTQQTVANQQGQINTIKTDAAGIHQALTGQGNQIANINVTLSGLNTKYEGVSGDLGKLTDKVTTNSTQIDQNKKAITLKADQLTVDNLSGEVSQNKAQLKVQADQISSKVSSTEYQTLKGKVDGMRIGGRNYLRDSNKSVSSYMQDLGTMPDDVMTSLAGKTITVSADVEWNNFVKDSNVQNRLGFEIAVHRSDGLDQWFGTWKYPTTSNGRERISSTFNVPAGLTFTVANNGQNGYVNMEGTGIVSHAKVEIGTTATDWTPAPEDTITAIQKNSTAIGQTNQKISLKADQTEVDQIKNTASQNSSRLKVMANEISSKVTSTDVNNIVDGKGYATTSTVQSLIAQKAGSINETITNLTSKVNGNNGGGINLLSATDFSSTDLNKLKDVWGSGFTLRDGCAMDVDARTLNSGQWTDAAQTVKVEPDTDYTLSFEVYYSSLASGGSWNSIQTFLLEFQDEATSKTTSSYIDNGRSVVNSNKRSDNIQTIHTQPDCHYIKVIFRANAKTQFSFIRPKFERGSVATPWSPAPSDLATVTQVQQITASIDGIQSTVANKADKSQITQLSNVIQSKVSASDFNNLRKAVDLQTLESADANNLKTNGHYFVHNLANNPVGGWVYVDVTGNGADRIRQDVYQDSGNQHKYRRWFGNSWTNWSEGATESEITQLRDDINLRVKKGDLLSQINIAAGHTLIQSNKIYFDADSFVMSANSKAFIPSAFITNISADKITTGTLDAAKLHVKNFSADNISGGTLSGITVKTGDKNRYFQTSKDSIYWVRDNKTSLIGTDQYINPSDGLVIADTHSVTLTTWHGATINSDGSITNEAGNIGHPKIVIDLDGKWNPEASGGSNWETGTGATQIGQWVADKEYTNLVQGKGFNVRLDDQNKNSIFSIQKDNCVGAYFGQGDHGNQINFFTAGDDQAVNITGNFHVTGSKNSIVETKQGYLAINAYETAEYYFGDIGESNTGSTGQIVIGIDRIFNETVNTDIQYQVFVTPYSDARVWVEKRYNNRFVVKSDKPDAEFGWELKAKRKGYESNRLRRVNVDFDQANIKGDN